MLRPLEEVLIQSEQRRAGCLTVVRGERIGLTLRVGDDAVVVGRGEGVDAFVTGEGTSRRHAELVPSGGGYIKLVDLGSRNGSYVNGLRVTTVVLDDGDQIRIGDTEFDFRYVREDERTTVNLEIVPPTTGTGASDLVSSKFIATVSRAAEVDFAEGRFAEALAAYDRGRTALQATPGARPRQLAALLRGIGCCQLELGAPRMAIEPFRRGIELQLEAGATARELSELRFFLATAIGGGDARGPGLMALAREPLDPSLPADQALVGKIERWLAANG